MDFDSFQKAWQSQASQTRVTIDADLLRKEVQRSAQNFSATILGRDFRELVVGLLLLPVWFYMGHQWSLPWSWWLGIPAITWVCLFIVVDRIRHKQCPSEPGEPLLDCVDSSLTQVEHQIWLLRNVFWWYLLPFTIAIMAFFTQVAWQRTAAWWTFALALAPNAIFLLVLYGFVYWLNQHAVRRTLAPRREELLTLRASLDDETSGERVSAASLDDIKNPGVFRQALFVTALSAVTVGLLFLADMAYQSTVVPALKGSRGTPAAFANLIADQREEKNLVGLSALVTIDGKVVASAVNGERRWGSGVMVELGDEWNISGITTSITATMIARLIESGQLQWSTTIGECFPDAPIHDDWKSVTFQELLTHTAGVPPLPPGDVMAQRPPLGPECMLARREMVLKMLANKPDNPPGTKYAYSNVDSTIAAAMAEKKTGAMWEDLVKREVFERLGLKSAGFGPPKSPDASLPQPHGHRPYLGAKAPADDTMDNTNLIAPSGAVHMTLADLSTYAAEHLRGQLGKGKLLSAETYQRLHTPRLHDYAYGWGKKEPSKEIPYTVYWHNGSNTLWYALVVFIPEKNMVVAVAANDGDWPSAQDAAWEIVKASVKQFSAEVDPARGEPLQKADYPKKSPFAGIRWEGDKPVVQIGNEWYTLVSLDGIAAGDIVAFSRRTYANKWQKRFEEDLVEVLTRMGHEPMDTVRLVVLPLESQAARTLENVPMTEANRRAIYDGARARERAEQQPAPHSAARAKDAKAPLTDLVPRLRKENNLVGLTAMAMVDGKVVASAVDGERKTGSGVPLEIGDRWHLGSITKSTTATMIARLVESGQPRLPHCGLRLTRRKAADAARLREEPS